MLLLSTLLFSLPLFDFFYKSFFFGSAVKSNAIICLQITLFPLAISQTRGSFEIQSEKIRTSVEEINGISDKITVLEQHKVRIADNIRMLSEISRKNAENGEEVNRNIMQIIEDVQVVNDRCESRNAMAEQLLESVTYFHD